MAELILRNKFGKDGGITSDISASLGAITIADINDYKTFAKGFGFYGSGIF